MKRSFIVRAPCEVLITHERSINKMWYTTPAAPLTLKEEMKIAEKWLVGDPFTQSGARANTVCQHFAKMFHLYIFHCPSFRDVLEGRSILIVNHNKVTIEE